MNIQELPTDDLVAELQRRGVGPRCMCKRWTTYFGAYDRHGLTLRCRGCLKIPPECRCL